MKAVHSQYLIAVIASSVMIPYGQAGAWLMIAIPALQSQQDDLNLTSDHVGWIASSTPIFIVLGSVISRYLMDTIGRRNSLIAAMLPLLCAYLVMGFNTFEAYLIGRALTGVSFGFSPILSLYFGEIANDEIRGRMNFIATTMSIASTLPVLLASPFLSLRSLNFYLLVPTMIVVLLLCMIPESPYFYLMKGDSVRAEEALRRIRDGRQASLDLVSIKHYVDTRMKYKSNFDVLWKSRGSCRAFAINLWLVMYLDLSGTAAIKNYSALIFEKAHLPLAPGDEVALIMVITIVVSCLAAMYVDNLGRRCLLFLASVPMVIAMLTAAVFYFFKETNHDVARLSWVPWIAVLLINVAYSAGLRPLKHILRSEYYPLDTKAAAVSLTYIVEALVDAIAVKLFQESTDFLGFGYVFSICLVIYVIGTVVMYFFMPETKNLSFVEIERVFE